jgi:hypothetical protein
MPTKEQDYRVGPKFLPSQLMMVLLTLGIPLSPKNRPHDQANQEGHERIQNPQASFWGRADHIRPKKCRTSRVAKRKVSAVDVGNDVVSYLFGRRQLLFKLRHVRRSFLDILCKLRFSFLLFNEGFADEIGRKSALYAVDHCRARVPQGLHSHGIGQGSYGSLGSCKVVSASVYLYTRREDVQV